MSVFDNKMLKYRKCCLGPLYKHIVKAANCLIVLLSKEGIGREVMKKTGIEMSSTCIKGNGDYNLLV